MRKYLEISKIIFKTQLVWRFDIAVNVLFTVAKIIFAFLLWKSIFNTQLTVAGFTFDTMLSYYIINSFFSQLDMSEGIANEISYKIRNGSFSKYMVIPVNTQGYFIAQTAGTSVFYLLFNLLAASIWIFVFRIRFALAMNPFNILEAVFMVLLGLLFMIQLNYFLGLLTLKFQNIYMFLMIKSNIMLFITGALVPLALLPKVILNVLNLLPFYYVSYLPSMLMIGRNENEIGKGFIVLCFWISIFLLINKYTYNRLRVKYDGVGI